MKTNEGTIDRVVRIILGFSMLSLVILGPKSYWGLIGIIPLVTGLIGWCPLYRIFNIQTCPLKIEGKN